jgi:hypothetical protein
LKHALAQLLCLWSVTLGMDTRRPPDAFPLRNPASVLSIEVWAAETKRLLVAEKEEEIAVNTQALLTTDAGELEAAGKCLLNLRVSETSAGLFGRTVITVSDWMDRLLPANKFSIGDIVALRAGKDASSPPVCTGIVSAVSEWRLNVAVDEGAGGDGDVDYEQQLGDRVRVDVLANDVTYKRLADGIAALEAYKFGPASRVINVCVTFAVLHELRACLSPSIVSICLLSVVHDHVHPSGFP